MRKIFFGIALIIVGATLAFTPVSAEEEIPISDYATSLNLLAQDATSVSIYYSFPSGTHTFNVYNSNLVNKDIFISGWKLQAVLNELTHLYPGTRLLAYHDNSGMHPTADIDIYFKDGTHLEIWASSQFANMIPWNIRVSNDQDGSVPQNYVLFHDGLHKSLSRIWQDLEGKDFLMGVEPEEWISGWNTPPKTYEFNHADRFADAEKIFGAENGKFDVFIPWLIKNETLNNLFEQGYTIYDAVFSIEISILGQYPVGYRGMLALRLPDSPDIVVGEVNIRLEPEIEVSTTFDEEEIMSQVKSRQKIEYTNTLIEIFPDIVFILDHREPKPYADGYQDFKYHCPNSEKYTTGEYYFEAQLTEHDFLPLTFVKTKEQGVWALDVSFDPQDYTADQVSNLFNYLLPAEFNQVSAESIEYYSTNFSLHFDTDEIDEATEMLDHIQSSNHSAMYIHKSERHSSVRVHMVGITLVNETGEEPDLEYCGILGDPYDTTSVVAPINLASPPVHDPPFQMETSTWPNDIYIGKTGSYTRQREIMPSGYGYLLTSTAKGVFFSEGFIDESGDPQQAQQRLGDQAARVAIATNQAGDVHLFWANQDPPYVTVHLWRPAGGEWQAPEFLENVRLYPEQILYLDENNVLLMLIATDDGIDHIGEYKTWSETDGFTSPSDQPPGLGTFKQGNDGITHVVWTRDYQEPEYIDPDNGRRDYGVGIFYAYRDNEGNWSSPEKIGLIADYGYPRVFAFDLIDDRYPLIVWQHPNDDIMAIIKNESGKWGTETLILSVYHPEESNVSGWGHGYSPPTADLALFSSSEGPVYLAISAFSNGIYIMTLEDYEWGEVITITSDIEMGYDGDDPPTVNFRVTVEGVIRLKYGNSYYDGFASDE